MSAYALVPVTTETQWAALHDIRRAVLFAAGRHEREVVYDDNHPDDHAPGHQPYVLTHGTQIVGTVRLDRRPDGRAVVRLVAIAGPEQGRGHGRQLSDLIDVEARRMGVGQLLVNAAHDAVGYYERMGWHEGEWDRDELVGIASRCVQMSKAL